MRKMAEWPRTPDPPRGSRQRQLPEEPSPLRQARSAASCHLSEVRDVTRAEEAAPPGGCRCEPRVCSAQLTAGTAPSPRPRPAREASRIGVPYPPSVGAEALGSRVRGRRVPPSVCEEMGI